MGESEIVDDKTGTSLVWGKQDKRRHLRPVSRQLMSSKEEVAPSRPDTPCWVEIVPPLVFRA